MRINKKNLKEVEILKEIEKRVDNITAEEVNRLSDELSLFQPFVISLLLGYRFDVDDYQLDEIMKILFIIWLNFENKPGVRKEKITIGQYENNQKRNIEFLHYYSKEDNKGMLEGTRMQLGKLKSKALFINIIYRFEKRQYLERIDRDKRGIIIIGMKSLIESFENLS